MFVVLVTNKGSNILEDLDTLRILAKLIPEYSSSLTETGILHSAFEIIFAFDEVISMGAREGVNLNQVRENLEMDSHEERLHKMIMQSKVDSTTAAMKQKALEIEKAKMARRLGGGAGGAGGYPGGPGGGYRAIDVDEPSPRGRGQAIPSPNLGLAASVAMGRGASGSGSRGLGLLSGGGTAAGGARGGGGGGGGSTTTTLRSSVLDQLRAEGEAVDHAPTRPGGGAGAKARAGGKAAGTSASSLPPGSTGKPVLISLEEKLSATLSRDGTVESLDVQGGMSITVLSESQACVRVQLTSPPSAHTQAKTHPNIDKAAHAQEGVIQLRDPTRPFPAKTTLTVLKWRSTDTSRCPLVVSCWPNQLGPDEMSMTLEFEAGDGFHFQAGEATVVIPGMVGEPRVTMVDGEAGVVPRDGTLEWRLPGLEAVGGGERSGALEFVVSGRGVNADSFFPIQIHVQSETLFTELAVADVSSTVDGAAVEFDLVRKLGSDRFVVA